MSDRLRYERLVWFHGRIKSGRFPNTRHLIEEFEISERTAQRDVEFLRNRLQAPLKFNHTRRGYLYTEDGFELPSHWITEGNVLALALAVRLASTIPDQVLKDDLCRLIDRMTGITGKQEVSCLTRLDQKISVKNIEYARVDTAIFRQAVEALFHDRVVAITYHSPHGSGFSSRTIRPLHLMHYMGSWHLLAWCTHRQNIRDFALARIRSVTQSDIAVALPESLPPIKEYTRRHFGIMQGNEATLVSLKFSQRVSPLIAEQVWHPEQQISMDPGGSLTLSFPAADFRELVKIILSHGAEVRVVEPLELREMIREEIGKMANIHGNQE